MRNIKWWNAYVQKSRDRIYINNRWLMTFDERCTETIIMIKKKKITNKIHNLFYFKIEKYIFHNQQLIKMHSTRSNIFFFNNAIEIIIINVSINVIHTQHEDSFFVRLNVYHRFPTFFQLRTLWLPPLGLRVSWVRKYRWLFKRPLWFKFDIM